MVIALHVTTLVLNIKFKQPGRMHFIFLISLLIFANILILSIGLLFYYGSVLQLFMSITCDVRKVDADFD
jgi:hypothetical protein